MSRLIHWWVKLRHRDHPVSMVSSLNRAERALILVGGGRDVSLFRDLAYIVRSFPIREVGIVFPEGLNLPRLGLNKVTFLPLKPSDINLLAIPKREFIRRIQAGRYHLAIDLDATGAYIWAYTCLKSGAPLRIGIGNGASWPYHNIVILPCPSK